MNEVNKGIAVKHVLFIYVKQVMTTEYTLGYHRCTSGYDLSPRLEWRVVHKGRLRARIHNSLEYTRGGDNGWM